MKEYGAGTMKSIAVFCREVDKNSGNVAVYLCKREARENDLHCLSIRARLNPELRYYATDTRRVDDAEEWEEIVRDLKRHDVEKQEKAMQELGIIVKL